MKKIELLSPAGDMKCLKMAVKCGCDAVYISGKEYGARKYAGNFTVSEIEEAVRFCHLYDAKLYVTVNTLIEEDEIDSFTLYVKKLHEIGVDALIVQDIGMISYLHKKFPNLEIHASTQTHNCSNLCLSFLEDLGVKRAVLARELSLSQIEKLDTNLELEVFIHGALCVSYSGQCLMSSFLFGRSGNKGECAQVCRFCFDMYDEDKKVDLDSSYLLSTKELNVGRDIVKLIELGISSLKIEGRMKSPYYVGYVTKFYRTLIDKYYNGEEVSFSEEEYLNLLTLYNREFTNGFLNDDKFIINPKTCNHQGSLLGEIISFSDKIKILLSNDLNQGDGVRFSNGEGMICNFIYNEKGLLINSASKGDIIYLDNKVNLGEKGYLYKTLSVSLNKELDCLEDKKILVDFNVTARVGEELSITIICGVDKITKSMGIVEEAINSSVSKEDIYDKLSKLGNTPFKVNDISFDIDDNIFIPIKSVNNLRRDLVSCLINLRENRKEKVFISNESVLSRENVITNEFSFLVRNEEQLLCLLDKDVNIYVEDYNLYKKYKNDKIFYRNPRADFNYKDSSNSLISNNGGFKKYLENSVSDIYMNVKNSYTLGLFSNYVYKVGLSPELSLYQIQNVISSYKNRNGYNPNVEVLIYGNLELMLMKYCPIKYLVNSNDDKCMACLGKKYFLNDRNGKKFRLIKDSSHHMRVMSYVPVDMISDIELLKDGGVTNFRIDLLDEGEEEIKKILRRLKLV